MSNRPLVSFCTPTYNCAAYIGKLCDSLQAQTCGDFEVLFGDDGSKDNTQEVLAPYLEDSRFRLLTWSPNRGYGRATAQLISEARGEFWCHPGADDILHPDFVATRSQLLQKNPDAVLAHGPPILIDPEDRVIETDRPEWSFAEGTHWPSLSQLVQHNVINAPGIMARMSVTREILPCLTADWRYAFDWYIWQLLAAAGGDFVWDPVPRMRYRLHPSSLSFSPEAAAWRQAETRLVPLYALSVAARISGKAAELWSRYRLPLYTLWLARAARLSRRGLLRDEWLQVAAQAFDPASPPKPSLSREWLKHAPSIAINTVRERSAARRQAFRVSGLALVDDPAFQKSSSVLRSGAGR